MKKEQNKDHKVEIIDQKIEKKVNSLVQNKCYKKLQKKIWS